MNGAAEHKIVCLDWKGL